MAVLTKGKMKGVFAGTDKDKDKNGEIEGFKKHVRFGDAVVAFTHAASEYDRGRIAIDPLTNKDRAALFILKLSLRPINNNSNILPASMFQPPKPKRQLQLQLQPQLQLLHQQSISIIAANQFENENQLSQTRHHNSNHNHNNGFIRWITHLAADVRADPNLIPASCPLDPLDARISAAAVLLF
ncbi:hypothetical protein HK100_002036 [Physocladia obscura]|uniref:Uncharacterized protein n=1 Tax=Physocladia obscura TaxID=109957 RepID=A0AAD5XBD8_9FUNG|nr:hypothetical protein HK100_002036 [Physocladia obscura]